MRLWRRRRSRERRTSKKRESEGGGVGGVGGGSFAREQSYAQPLPIGPSTPQRANPARREEVGGSPWRIGGPLR